MTTDERIDAIDRIKGDCAQTEVDWLATELRRARAALKEIAHHGSPGSGACTATCGQLLVNRARAALARVAEAPGLADNESARDAACGAIAAYGLGVEQTVLCAHAVLRAIDQRDAKATVENPCARCGISRTVAEGGRIFTVCDDCWDKP